MQYSPKLKKAMEQIKSILKEHDIAAFVLLHDERGFSEYLNAVSPSYSCAFVSEPEGIRVRLKQAEVGKEKAKQLAEGTYNMIAHFADMIGKHAIMYIDAVKMLDEHWDADKFPGNDTGHTTQNN